MERIAIVTGANHGVGLETARGLRALGFHVVLAVRDIAKGEAAAREIGGGEVMRVDVADTQSVRAFAAAFRARHARLDVLVNNAGIHTSERVITKEGIENTFATNHVGHFLLTQLLLDLLRSSAPSRVVNVASQAHRIARDVETADLTGDKKWNGLVAYARSKLANIMFTYALARRLEGTGVSTFAVHPGTVRTGWARGRDSGSFAKVVALVSPFLISPAKGARTSIYAATSPELEGKNGLYLAHQGVARSTPVSRDVERQERLWRATEALVGP